jgi:rhodanese-related sulfurtransferase
MYLDERSRKIKIKKYYYFELDKLIKTEKNLFILDVRPENFSKLTIFIKGTVRCSLMTLNKHYTLLPKDKDIIITDAFSKQAAFAAKFLVKNGYNVKGLLKGGIGNWEKQNLEVVDEHEVKYLKNMK